MESTVYRTIIAEDEELLLHNMVQKVQNSGLNFEVVGTAQTGAQAICLIKDLSPDLLITDIKMPVMDGMALLEKVYQNFPTLRTVIISGFSDFEYAQQAIRFRVDNYLLKPIDEEELYQTLFKIKTELELEQQENSHIFEFPASTNSREEIAEMLHEYINHNYTEDINLNSIAHNMNYSPSYLTKIFNQMYRTTPTKYIISRRMQKAKHLLLHHPEYSIGQIGNIVGYPEQGYFSRIFKKQTGVSPFEYRENNGS